MQSGNGKITLIMPAVTKDATGGFVDRKGGKTHGSTGSVHLTPGSSTTTREVETGTVKTNLEQSMKQVRGVLVDLKREATEGWELDGITVSLAVEANGSCGIVTAGVPANLEMRFVPASQAEPSEEAS